MAARSEGARFTSLLGGKGGAGVCEGTMGTVEPVCDNVKEPFECETAEVLGRDGARLESREPDMLLDSRRNHVCGTAPDVLPGCCDSASPSTLRRDRSLPALKLARGVNCRLLLLPTFALAEWNVLPYSP